MNWWENLYTVQVGREPERYFGSIHRAQTAFEKAVSEKKDSLVCVYIREYEMDERTGEYRFKMVIDRQ